MHSLEEKFLMSLTFTAEQLTILRTIGEYQGKQELYFKTEKRKFLLYANKDDAVKKNPSNSTESLVALPEPTGPYSIGISKYDLDDIYRKNFQFPQGRLIPIQIYFPMEQGNHAIYPKIFEKRAALGPFELLNVNGHSQPTDLSLLIGGQHPVVIINHASCVAMTDYAFLAEDLASHGYVVISIQHDLKSEEVEPAFWEGRSCSRKAKVIDNILYVFEWLKITQATQFKKSADCSRKPVVRTD